MTPKPYKQRFSGGVVEDVEWDDSGYPVSFVTPPVEVLYPGEAVTIDVVWNGEELIHHTVVYPAPGLRAWLTRLRYRLLGDRGSEAKLVVDSREWSQ